MVIDTHAHLNFAAFDEDREQVIKRCLDNNVWMINVGTNLITSKKAVDMAQQYPQGVFASVGLHPINLDTGLVKKREDKLEGGHYEAYFDFEEYKKLAVNKKVVAIGEAGLDYYWRPKTAKKKELFKEKQRELLVQEIKLAEKLNLPVIFHSRMAHKDLLKVLSNCCPKKAVAHSFVGTVSELKQYLSLGFFIGFNGIIFKGIQGIDFTALIKEVPMEKIMIETDCPYLVPQGINVKRNEPVFVVKAAERIAEIKKVTTQQMLSITFQNAKTLFNV